MELWLQAGGLGCARSYGSIANAYYNGTGVQRDEKKAEYYWELAAMRGDLPARHNIGVLEGKAGNISRAMKHWMISAAAGCDDSLKKIRVGFFKGHVTKDDYENTSLAHYEAKDEMKSDQREAAAAFDALYDS